MEQCKTTPRSPNTFISLLSHLTHLKTFETSQEQFIPLSCEMQHLGTDFLAGLVMTGQGVMV